MPFTLPNLSAAAVDDQAVPDRVDFDVLVAGIGGTGVLSGCEVTAQATADMTVAVAAGVVRTGAADVTVAGGNATVGAAHSTLARFDLVCATDAGAVAAVAGTPAAVPEFPVVPPGYVALAAVYVAPLVSAINGNRIIDKRVLVPTQVASAMVVVSHGATAATARPAGAAAVYWVGSVEPTNALDHDLWYDTSGA